MKSVNYMILSHPAVLDNERLNTVGRMGNPLPSDNKEVFRPTVCEELPFCRSDPV